MAAAAGLAAGLPSVARGVRSASRLLMIMITRENSPDVLFIHGSSLATIICGYDATLWKSGASQARS